MDKSREAIENKNYWLNLVPEATISKFPSVDSSQVIKLDSQQIHRYRQSLIEEGYFQADPIIPEGQLDRLLHCTSQVMGAGHPPAYALLYDDFFEILAYLDPLLYGLLGEGYLMVPDEPDIYFIPTSPDFGGAEPHRDTLRRHDMYDPDGLPAIINIWIPLTDATPGNSCMHIIPSHCDPDFKTPASDEELPESIDTVMLQSVRALPARAGSVLGWSTELIHWGGQSSGGAETPRLSFAMYFQSSRMPKFHPTARPCPVEMTFEQRLYMVEKVWRDPDGLEVAEYIPD